MKFVTRISLPTSSVSVGSSVVLESNIAFGLQGNPGEPGPPGGAAIQRKAGETLSALTVVYELNGEVFVLDHRDGLHIDLIRGITINAAQKGMPINIQALGSLEDSAWDWTPGRLYLGPQGSLTEDAPTEGFDVLIGAAVSSTSVVLNIQDPIELE